MDLEKGVLALVSRDGPRRQMTVQLLGSESEESNTWLWAWANDCVSVPERVRSLAIAIRQWGEKHQVDALVRPHLALGRFGGRHIAAAATVLSKGDGYYRAPYEGGAAYVVVQAPELRSPSVPSVRIPRIFVETLSKDPIADPRRALAGYLRSFGWDVRSSPERIEALANGESVFTASLDAQGRPGKMEFRIR
ncbi:MAG: hypothetical protein HYY17_01150 [Planctomycetes bacterium]|nr:hypothetical protein [Planctomycetota bacterium]